MDFKELVTKRSSLRSFSNVAIKHADIDACIEAARLAPSACNSQPWQFIVVDKPDLKAKLSSAMLSGIQGMNSFIKDAPVLIVVVTDTVNWLMKVCNTLQDTKLYLIDLGIACEHFMLQAQELGIGTCMLGWFNEKAAKKLLSIPRSKRVHAVIAMGYPPDGYLPREKIRKSISEICLYL